MWALSLLAGLLVVLAITAATGYFVAQEFSYMAVDRSRLKSRAARGDVAAQRALGVTQRTSFMLSGAQLGITVTALLVGYVAEPLIGESLGTAMGGIGVPTGVGIAIGTVLALLFSTFVQMLFGELFPKNLAISRPEPVAVRLAASTTVYLRVFGWLIRIFDAAANLLLRLVRIEPVHDVEHAATVRDLEHIVAGSRDSGDLPDDLSVLLDRVLDFPERDVEHAMIPRARVDIVRTDDPFGEVWSAMSSGHSRYPVLSDDDEVVGVLHLQDVLAAGEDSTRGVASLMRSPLVIPTVMTLPVALRTLSESKNQLACVLDEYGGFAGVLTLEDLAEELVGEITDEHDPVLPEPTTEEEEGSWLIPGDVHVDEVERTVHHDVPRGDYETLAGLVIAGHGALPDVGTIVEIPLDQDPALADTDEQPAVMTLEVVEIARRVPAQVRVTIRPAVDGDPAQAGVPDPDGEVR